MTHFYAQPIRDALLADGCPETEIDKLVPMQVWEFMLSHHGLDGWGPFLMSLHADTLGRQEPKPTDTYRAGDPHPEHLGAVTDMYKEVQEVRLAMDKDVKAVKARENELKEYIIQNLEKDPNSKGAIGMKYKAVINTDRKPKLKEEGWTELHAYIQQTGRFDLLQKRMNDKAIMDMYENGELPPGVETIQVPKVSVTKV